MYKTCVNNASDLYKIPRPTPNPLTVLGYRYKDQVPQSLTLEVVAGMPFLQEPSKPRSVLNSFNQYQYISSSDFIQWPNTLFLAYFVLLIDFIAVSTDCSHLLYIFS